MSGQRQGHQGACFRPQCGQRFAPQRFPCRPNARYVLWSRVDQKTCLKAITAAGGQRHCVLCCAASCLCSYCCPSAVLP